MKTYPKLEIPNVKEEAKDEISSQTSRQEPIRKILTQACIGWPKLYTEDSRKYVEFRLLNLCSFIHVDLRR